MALFAIHSTVRAKHTRTARTASPGTTRLKQFVGRNQTRLVRGRPIFMDEDELVECIDDLREKENAGVIEVRSEDGRLLDLRTLALAEAKASVPLANPPLDSLANDPKRGQYMPPPDAPMSYDPNAVPALVSQASEVEPDTEDEPTAAPPPDDSKTKKRGKK
jgi:hypothetical protein